MGLYGIFKQNSKKNPTHIHTSSPLHTAKACSLRRRCQGGGDETTIVWKWIPLITFIGPRNNINREKKEFLGLSYIWKKILEDGALFIIMYNYYISILSSYPMELETFCFWLTKTGPFSAPPCLVLTLRNVLVKMMWGWSWRWWWWC